MHPASTGVFVPAIEDFRLDIIIDQGPKARTILASTSRPSPSLHATTRAAGMPHFLLLAGRRGSEPARLLLQRRVAAHPHPPARLLGVAIERGRARSPAAPAAPPCRQPPPALGARTAPR
ncbi:MAG: hypothetical protein R3F13_02370 [Prosthecobacter sp.]